MKDSEAMTGVKITTLCPGGVATPLFDAAKIKQFSATKDAFLRPETCAEHLLALLQKKKYPCGSVLEATLLGTRLIPEWNVQPPEGQGVGQDLDQQFVERLLEPIQRVLKTERVNT